MFLPGRSANSRQSCRAGRPHTEDRCPSQGLRRVLCSPHRTRKRKFSPALLKTYFRSRVDHKRYALTSTYSFSTPRRISPAAISVPRNPVAPLKKMISLTCRSPSCPEFPDTCRIACIPNAFYAFELYAIMLVNLQRFVNIYSAAAPTEGG